MEGSWEYDRGSERIQKIERKRKRENKKYIARLMKRILCSEKEK